MKRFHFLLIFLLSGCLQSFAQRETDNWYFGQNASLEFNAAGLPVSFQNSAMNSTGGSASISDKSGNLLFYTDGVTIWNRLHQPMTNGTGLLGTNGAAQSAIIIPKPGSNSHYYVFTKQISNSTFGNNYANLRYSEVDITANNGMGEVISSSKNTGLLGMISGYFVSDKITAVHHANHQDIWVITPRYGTSTTMEFVALKITSSGIDPNPVVSSAPLLGAYIQGGVMKASPDGKHLALTWGPRGAWLMDFNNRTGQITNQQVLLSSLNTDKNAIGAEFSPDGSKLYLSYGKIMQFDLSLPTTAAILGSQYDFGHNVSKVSMLQLAKNGKIYVSWHNTTSLMEIANPNADGIACNYKQGPALATGTSTYMGLPNFIQSYFAPPRFEYTGICAGSPISFTITNQTNIDSVRWNFGDPTSIFNKSTALQPSHTFSVPGLYTVQLNVFQQGFQSVFERDITILNKPLVQLPKDTSVCEGTIVSLMNSYPTNPFNERFLWSTGEKDSVMIRVSQPGVYWLELTNGVCTTRDSIVIQHRKKPKVNLGNDRTQCGNAPIILDAGNPGAKYLWQPNNETTQTISVTKPGVYSVIVTANRCSAADIITINFNDMPGFDFGADISVCEGEPVVLKTIPVGPGIFYTWSDSSKKSELQVSKSGKYWATVNQNGCLFTDSINVTFRSCPPPIVPYIPNIISPNNDNRNDKFVIEKIPIDSWALKIYNRWGKLIYTNDRYNHSWPENTVPHGTYYYLLEEPDTGRKFKGWVEVVK